MYETLITQYGGPVYFRAQMAADAGIDPMLFDALWIPSENDRTIGKQTLEETIEQKIQRGDIPDYYFRKKGSKSRLFLSSSSGNHSDASDIKRKKD